jgi:hypothetical protein
MTSIVPRIKVEFETKEFWFLIESQKYKTIRDLKNELMTKLSITYEMDVFLENGLITDWQSIQILRDNDLITIKTRNIEYSMSSELLSQFSSNDNSIDSNNSINGSQNTSIGFHKQLVQNFNNIYNKSSGRQNQKNNSKNFRRNNRRNGSKKSIDRKVYGNESQINRSIHSTRNKSNQNKINSMKESDNKSPQKSKRIRRHPNKYLDFF